MSGNQLREDKKKIKQCNKEVIKKYAVHDLSVLWPTFICLFALQNKLAMAVSISASATSLYCICCLRCKCAQLQKFNLHIACTYIISKNNNGKYIEYTYLPHGCIALPSARLSSDVGRYIECVAQEILAFCIQLCCD